MLLTWVTDMADGLIFSSPFAAVCPLETVKNCPLEVAEPVAASVGMIGEADRLKAHYFFFCQKLHNWPLPTKPVIVLTYSYWRFHFWSWGSDGLRCLSALLVCEQCDCIARWSECWEWWEWLWVPIVIGSRLPTDRHCTRDVLWFGDLRSLCSCRPYLDFV